MATATSSSSSLMLFNISSGIPGYCISFPFSLLFVAGCWTVKVCPLGLTVAHAFSFSLLLSLPLAFALLLPLYPTHTHTPSLSISVRFFVIFFFLSQPSSLSSSSSRTTPTMLPTSCYRANFRCFILTQWCALKARWATAGKLHN